MFANNADKIVINSLLFSDVNEVEKIASKFGRQSLIISLDYKKVEDKEFVYTNNGINNTKLELNDAIEKAYNSGAGEIYLTSINRDGTGFGYDLETLNKIEDKIKIPIILSGGVGKFDHLLQGLLEKKVNGVSTANILIL